MFATAIVVAAGKGERFQSKIPKPLVKIGGKPIVIYSLQALSLHPAIREIIVVANPLNVRPIISQIRQYGLKKITCVTLGGKRRQDSVYNGLKLVDPKTDLVLVHDAARPFINKNIIWASLKAGISSGAAVVGVPVKATIKKIKTKKQKGKSQFIVEKTIDRQNLWEIQTPQVFKAQVLLKAFTKFGKNDVTDEAMLVEKSGGKVVIVPGVYENIKITVPQDLILAEAILKSKKVKVWNTGPV
jgi:2-C-methyl-D-erythritol 4-phosphate cytidylyltransferase